MQINGQSLSTSYVTRNNEPREGIRPPVIIDAEPQSNEARPLLPPTTEAPSYQAQLTEESDRQARFIRLLAGVDETDTVEFDPAALPQGVQQYLQVAGLETASTQQRLFDEIV